MRVSTLMTFIFSVAYKQKSSIKHEEIDYIFGDFRKGLKHDNEEIIGTNEQAEEIHEDSMILTCLNKNNFVTLTAIFGCKWVNIYTIGP